MKTKFFPMLGLALALTAALLAGCASDDSDIGALSSFTAVTLDGGSFTQADIQSKDATAINFWGTFCAPCIGEMPALGAYAQALPENVQLITVCVDGSDNLELAKAILKDSGYEGVTLLSGDGDLGSMMENIQSLPTTIFVDSQGKCIGSAVIGARPDLAQVYTDRINAVLKEAGKAALSLETP